MEVVHARLSVERAENTTPARCGSVLFGVDDAAGPGLESGSEGVEVVFDREAQVPGEDHSDEHGAESKSVTDEEVVLGQAGSFVGHHSEHRDDYDREEGEDTGDPDKPLQVVPQSLEVVGQGLGFFDEQFVLKRVASSGTRDGDSGSAVEDDSVLLGVGCGLCSLEDGRESNPGAGARFICAGRSSSCLRNSAPGVRKMFFIGDKPQIVIHGVSELSVLLVSTKKTTTFIEVSVDKRPGSGFADMSSAGEGFRIFAGNGVLELEILGSSVAV